MLLRTSEPTQNRFVNKFGQDPRLQNGKIWIIEREAARFEKLKEQKHARELLEKYWPWEKHIETKPRGLRNLRLEGIFPQKDFEKVKRTVMAMGRPGGGAPNMNEQGLLISRTKEDPLLRFQWGKDLRKCVDNTLRYRRSKEDQHQYKQELDKLVAAKFKQSENDTYELSKKSKLVPSAEKHKVQIKQLKIMNVESRLPKKSTKYCKILNENHANTNLPANILIKTSKPRQLSPLPNDCKDSGIELVPLIMAKRRQMNSKALGTTVVTKNAFTTSPPMWDVSNRIYLQELAQQMRHKLQLLEKTRQNDLENVRKHFSTLDTFWGRPGHGAPRSVLKKTSIDKLLYGSNYAMPVAVA